MISVFEKWFMAGSTQSTNKHENKIQQQENDKFIEYLRNKRKHYDCTHMDKQKWANMWLANKNA